MKAKFPCQQRFGLAATQWKRKGWQKRNPRFSEITLWALVRASLSPAGMGKVLANSQPEIQGLEALGGFQVLPGLVTVPKIGQETSRPPSHCCPGPFHHDQLSPSDVSRVQGLPEGSRAWQRCSLCWGSGISELLQAFSPCLKLVGAVGRD